MKATEVFIVFLPLVIKVFVDLNTKHNCFLFDSIIVSIILLVAYKINVFT